MFTTRLLPVDVPKALEHDEVAEHGVVVKENMVRKKWDSSMEQVRFKLLKNKKRVLVAVGQNQIQVDLVPILPQPEPDEYHFRLSS